MNDTLPIESGSELLRRFTAIQLLIAIAVLYVSMPFVEPLRSGPLIESILFSIVLISGVLAVADRRRVVIVAATLAIAALVGRWMNHFLPDLMPPELFLIGGILFVLCVIVNLLRFVLAASEVDIEVLCASISAYLLLGFLWTLAYWLVAELIPNAFAFNGADKSLAGFNGFYFSFITMSTVGYGDILPVAKVARMLAAMEAMTGLLYVATLIARLVALQDKSKSS
jgi:ion channel